MPINPTTLKALIDTQITNETVDFSITPGEVGGRMKDTIDYTTEQIALAEVLTNKSTNVATDGASNTKYPSVKSVKDYADGLVVGLLDDRGNYDASTNLFPASGGSGTAGAVMKGDLWYISVTGTLGGETASVGASVRALSDAPGQTSANWDILNVGLGFTPENVANKSTDVALGTSDTLYPTQNAVKTYVDANAGTPVTKVLKTTITNAQVLQLFTTPITILNSNNPLTVAYPINVFIKRNAGDSYTLAAASFSVLNDFNSVMTGNLNPNPLSSSSIGYFQSAISITQNLSGGDKNVLYKLRANVGNPTSGTGDLDVYVTYVEITL